MRNTARYAACVVVPVVAVVGARAADATSPPAHENVQSPSVLAAARVKPFSVSGSSIIFTATEIVHSVEPTATGFIQRSSVAGQLNGDLNGSILFNPTAVFDFVNGTLVNTGTQFFSGTIAGSGPVILYDDQFRFDIDLSTQETLGTVHLSRSSDAPHNGSWFECDLVVVGTGVTPEGDITSEYSGECVRRGNAS